MELAEVLRRATGHLQTHGSSSPRLDAELLLAHALGVRRLDLYLQHDRPLSESELAPFRDLIRQRAHGQPVAYLTGHREFMGLEFEVSPEVLVPNPDTETLVQRAVAWGRDRGGSIRIADVGTGSGCIAIAVAKHLPDAEVEASDVSAGALAVAARNVARHGLEARVRLREGDLLEGVEQSFDLILANLPYVANGADLAAEVVAQPAGALRGGPRGGELVARLLGQAISRLGPRGAVMAEMDPSISLDLLAVAEPIYAGSRVHRDLRGQERVLEAWRS